MSELKAYYPHANRDGFYHKSDVDKVITRLESDLAIKDNLNKLCLNALRHHKYHRCLDEAKTCQLRLERYERYLDKYKGNYGPTIKRWQFLKTHYEKWYECWLELAEKFKGA